MHETTIGCGCEGGSVCTCATLPAEFVRVRYYYGQRLGVMELSDQFLYHAGKMAFHNARLHGFGVLCGLKAEKQKPPAGTASTVLRVSTGAAVDPCGRELVVGVDQCIDVAAWFAANKNRPALAGWTANTTQPLHVAIRYRECPGDPAPAPRDPCGCDNGGCEFGRVREVFELGLFTPDEQVCAPGGAPARDAILNALQRGGPQGTPSDAAAALDRALAALVSAPCPLPASDRWLCLASFNVQLDATPVPVDLSDPDNAIPERRTLLSSRVLQDMLVALAADGIASGLLAAGPRPGALTFEPGASDPATAGTLSLQIVLAKKGTPAVDVPVVEATFKETSVVVSRLDATGWTDVTPAGGVAYDATTSPPRVKITFTQGLAAVTPFVLSVQAPPAEPILDADGAPLKPFVRRFRFVLDGAGALALDPTV